MYKSIIVLILYSIIPILLDGPINYIGSKVRHYIPSRNIAAKV